jgi:hypothetical protein
MLQMLALLHMRRGYAALTYLELLKLFHVMHAGDEAAAAL